MPRLAGTKTPLPGLTPKLGLRRRTGFFDSYETPDRRLKRLQALKRSETRQKARRLLDSAAPARRAAALRAARERLAQSREESMTSTTAAAEGRDRTMEGFGARLAERLADMRTLREERERGQQESDISAARERLKKVEARQQPLTVKTAGELLKGRQAETLERYKRTKARERLREVEARQQPPVTPPAKPQTKLEASLRKEFNALRKQWGVDARGMSLILGDVGGNLGGYYPDDNTLALDLDVVRSQVGREDKSEIPSLEGRDLDSLAHAVLRHEFAHAVQMARAARTGERDEPLESDEGRGFWLIDEAHGKAWNELNVAVQGSGSELGMPSVGLPPELRQTAKDRERYAEVGVERTSTYRPGRGKTYETAREFRGHQFQKMELLDKKFRGVTTPPRDNAEALDRLDLTGEQRAEVLGEMTKRGEGAVSTTDVYRFAGNVMAGREPHLDAGRYAQAEYDFAALGPENFKPIKTTRGPDGPAIPLILPGTTARGRLLADWQKQYREAGLTPAAANKKGAEEFDKQTSDFKEALSEELRGGGYSEKDVGIYIDGLLERELRRAELFTQAVSEWRRQNPGAPVSYVVPSAGAMPPDDALEEIDGQVNEAVAEEFEAFNKILEYRPKSVLDRAKETFEGVPVLEGVPRMGIGALEVLDAIGRPLTSVVTPGVEKLSPVEAARGERERRTRARGTLKIGGLPIGGANIDEALPDLLQGFEDYFGGGYKISRPLVEAAVPKPLERPLSAGLKYGLTAPIRASEEVAELLGVEARGKVSGKLAAKMSDEFAEDLIAEIINPAALLIVVPFVGHGVHAGMSTRRVAVQMISNLLGTGLEPGATGAFARWTTRLAKFGPRSALARAPVSVRGTRAYAIAMKNLRSEAGGMRVSARGVRLSEPAERMVTLADTGKRLKRAELLGAARGEGVGGPGNRLIRMSNEAIVYEIKAKKRMLERLAGQAKLITARPSRLTRATRRLLETTVAKGARATLKELRDASKRAGLEVEGLFRRPAQLTTGELAELGRLRAAERTAVRAAEPTAAAKFDPMATMDEYDELILLEEQQLSPFALSATDEARLAELQVKKFDPAITAARAARPMAVDLEREFMEQSARIGEGVEDFAGKLNASADELFERVDDLEDAGFLMDDGRFINTGDQDHVLIASDIVDNALGKEAAGAHDLAAADRFMKETRAIRVAETPNNIYAELVAPIGDRQKAALVGWATRSGKEKVVVTVSDNIESTVPLRMFEGPTTNRAQGLRRFLNDLVRDPPEFGRAVVSAETDRVLRDEALDRIGYFLSGDEKWTEPVIGSVDKAFKGDVRHAVPKVGEEVRWETPMSWSADERVASYFAQGEPGKPILFEIDGPVRAADLRKSLDDFEKLAEVMTFGRFRVKSVAPLRDVNVVKPIENMGGPGKARITGATRVVLEPIEEAAPAARAAKEGVSADVKKRLFEALGPDQPGLGGAAAPRSITELEEAVSKVSERVGEGVDDLPRKLNEAADSRIARVDDPDLLTGGAFLMDDGRFINLGEDVTHMGFASEVFDTVGKPVVDAVHASVLEGAYMDRFMKATKSIRLASTGRAVYVEMVGPINAAQRAALVKAVRPMDNAVATVSRVVESPTSLRSFTGDTQGLRRFLDDLERNPPEFGGASEAAARDEARRLLEGLDTVDVPEVGPAGRAMTEEDKLLVETLGHETLGPIVTRDMEAVVEAREAGKAVRVGDDVVVANPGKGQVPTGRVTKFIEEGRVEVRLDDGSVIRRWTTMLTPTARAEEAGFKAIAKPAPRAVGLGAEDAARLEELTEKTARAAEMPRDEKSLLLRELTNALRPRGVGPAAAERSITLAPPRAAGVVPGRLADVPVETVRRVVRDIVQGSPSRPDHLRIRGMVEEEAAKTGRAMEDLWDTNDFELLGREPLGAETSNVGKALADERRAAAAGSLRDFEEATRALRYSEDPLTRSRAIARETADMGADGSGIGRPPPDGPTTPHLPDPPEGTDPLPTLDTFVKWATDFEHTTANAAGALARVFGKAPPVRHMLEFLNPSPWFQGRVGHALGGYLNKGQGNRALHAAMTIKMSRGERGLFKFADNVAPNLRSVKDASIPITPEHLIQFPDDVVRTARDGSVLGKLTDDQRKFVDNARSLLKQEADYEFDVFSHAEFGRGFEELTEKEKGVIRRQLFDELGMEQGKYFHREVLNVKTMAEKNSLAQSRGAAIDWSRGFQKDRQFTTMWEGMENGVQYGDGITENVMARVMAGQSAALDKEVMAFLDDAGQAGELRRMIAKTQEGGRLGGIANTMAMFNNISRPMVTNADLGFMGLQVVPAASRSPFAALRGGMMVVDSLLNDQRQMASYISRQLEPQEFLGGKSWLEDFFNNGGIWNQNEFTWEYAAQGRGPASIFNRGAFRRFNNAFSGATNVASLEVYKGMVGVNDSLYRALGNRRATRLVTEAFGGFRIDGRTSRAQAASVANKLTLRMNSAAIGISKGQIKGEAALLFAPRYYRAFFGLLGDALQGGMRGAEARRSLGQMAAGFLAMNVALEAIPGVEPLQLDPRKPNFFTTKVGGLRVGPGGPFVSLFSLLGKATRRDREGDFLVDLPFGLGINPGLAKLNFDDNPLMRWGRGKLSPVASLIFDVLKGETFMYDKLESPMDYVGLLTNRLTPFFVQAGIDSYSKGQAIKDTATAAGIEFLAGARTWPESEFDVRAEVRDRVSQELYPGRNYDELNDAEKGKVKEDEEVVEADKKADEEAAERGYESSTKQAAEADYLKQFVETGEIKRDGEVTFSQFSTQGQDNSLFGRGELNGQDWIARYKDRQTEYYAFRGGIRTALGITFGDEEAGSAVDGALDAYFEVKPEQFLDAQAEPDWDEYFAAKDRAMQEAVRQGQLANGAQGAADVKAYLAPIEDDQTVRAFKEAQGTRDELEALPKYRFLDKAGEVQVDELLERVAAATAGAKERGVSISQRQFLKNILGAMPRDHELFDVVAVAYLRKTADTREQVWNPERDQLVLDDPMSVKFYISLYNNMSDANKLRFLDAHGTKYFSNSFIESEGLNPDLTP